MNYIDQNPVAAGLVADPAEWKAGGAYYQARNIPGLVDFSLHDHRQDIKLLSPIPPVVSRLIPPAQLEHILQFFGAYAEAIDKLYALVPTIPRIGESAFLRSPPVCLHYSTGTADYYVYEYDEGDTMYGKVCCTVYPFETLYQKFSLSALKGVSHLILPGVDIQNTPYIA